MKLLDLPIGEEFRYRTMIGCKISALETVVVSGAWEIYLPGDKIAIHPQCITEIEMIDGMWCVQEPVLELEDCYET